MNYQEYFSQLELWRPAVCKNQEPTPLCPLCVHFFLSTSTPLFFNINSQQWYMHVIRVRTEPTKALKAHSEDHSSSE